MSDQVGCKRFLAGIIVAVAYLTCVSISLAEPRLEDYVSSDTVGVGDIIDYEIVLTWDGSSPVTIKEDTPPQSELFKLISSRTTNRTELDTGKTVQKKFFHYRYESLDKGLAEFTRAQIKYQSPDRQDTALLSGKYFTVNVVPRGMIFRKNLILISAKVIIICLIFLMIAWASTRGKRAKNDKEERSRAIPSHVMEEKIADNIKEIAISGIKADHREYFKKLESILKDYIRQKYKIVIGDLRDVSVRSEVSNEYELIHLCRNVGDYVEKVVFGGFEVSPDEYKKIFKNCEKYFRGKVPQADPAAGLRLRN